MSFELDGRLRPYATDHEWKILEALVEHGTHTAAGLALNIDRSRVGQVIKSVKRKAAQQGYAPEYDLTHEIPAGMTARGHSTRYDAEGNVDGQWVKTKVQGRPPEETVQLPPDAKTINRVATLYDNQGQVTQQWVSESPKEKARAEAWRELAEALKSDLPRVEPTPVARFGRADLMVGYPLGDLHVGMLAWAEETGARWDLKIAESLMCSAATYLFDAAPDCEDGVIVILGDFFHYDGWKAVTPAHGNLLDADSRYPKMIRTGLRIVRFMIDYGLKKHARLRLIFERGNHDPALSQFAAEAIAQIYENEPRLTVDTSPRPFHYFEFGLNLVGVNHGENVKISNLPIIMATDVPEMWGRTKFRYVWTGHVHHDQTKDIFGCKVESFRVLAAPDGYAASKFRAMREMQSIVLHKDFGIVNRNFVNPDMFENRS